MSEDFNAHLMNEIHELNQNIIELSKQLAGQKKYLADVFNRIVWIQQKLGLRRMPKNE